MDCPPSRSATDKLSHHPRTAVVSRMNRSWLGSGIGGKTSHGSPPRDRLEFSRRRPVDSRLRYGALQTRPNFNWSSSRPLSAPARSSSKVWHAITLVGYARITRCAGDGQTISTTLSRSCWKIRSGARLTHLARRVGLPHEPQPAIAMSLRCEKPTPTDPHQRTRLQLRASTAATEDCKCEFASSVRDGDFHRWTLPSGVHRARRNPPLRLL